MLTLIDNLLVFLLVIDDAIDDSLIAEGCKGLMGTIAQFAHYITEETYQVSYDHCSCERNLGNCI